MNSTFKVAIVGGGASGLLCAVELLLGSTCLSGGDILLLERNDRVGKKLIVTGNGQGNLSNENLSISNYHGDKDFINAFSSNFLHTNLKEYFYNLGIPLRSDEEGRIYPLSKTASSVLDIIRAFLESKGVNILTNCYVTMVQKKDKFCIESSCGKYFSDFCVFAFGGKSAKQFGTDGTSYKLAQNLGHRLSQLCPSLVQLKTDTSYIRGLKGIKEQVKIKAFDGDEFVGESTGDLLFTDYGISGDSVFKISSVVMQYKKPNISIEFLPNEDNNNLLDIIKYKSQLKYIDKQEILTGLVNKRVGYQILKRTSEKTPKEILSVLKDFRLDILGSLDFDSSQVTKGGIITDDVNPFTLRSKLHKGLYLVGELLNVDGDCGGYNLTFAFISGINCARDIKTQCK